MAMREQYDFPTLPDHLRTGLDLVFVGINPGLYSVNRAGTILRAPRFLGPLPARAPAQVAAAL
jgi:hypothetical protein